MPATKQNYVYLILRNEQGDVKIVNSVNKRVTSLFPNKYSDIDIIFIYVDSINGKRKFFLSRHNEQMFRCFDESFILCSTASN